MSPKIRRLLVLMHMWGAGLMAPAFALHAISGGLYFIGIKGDVATTALSLPADAQLDFKSPDLEAQTRALLTQMGEPTDFDMIKDRGKRIQLRPTSRTHIEFVQGPTGLQAERVNPNFVRTMLELHLGHGPTLFKNYQKLVALMLLGVIFGGILVGIGAKAYRRQTIIAVISGVVIFTLLLIS